MEPESPGTALIGWNGTRSAQGLKPYPRPCPQRDSKYNLVPDRSSFLHRPMTREKWMDNGEES